jgi:hypothetical protein
MKLYAYSLPTVPEKSGWLKIGETRGGVDKLIHRYLKDKGFQIAVFEDTGADSEWIKRVLNCR